MQKYKTLKTVALIVALCAPLLLAAPVFAADTDIAKTQDFIKSIIQVASGFAGLIAVIFIIVGGYGYITSSGNPEKLDKSRHTLVWAVVGLAIVIGAFALSNIVTDLATKAFGK